MWTEGQTNMRKLMVAFRNFEKAPENQIVLTHFTVKGKGKSVPLQACSGPVGSRKLRFPDYMTTA